MVLTALCALGLSHCRVPGADEIDKKAYPCDPGLGDSDCGSTQSGSPLKCSSVLQPIRGRDVCAEECAGEAGVITEEYACLQNETKALRCRPSEGAAACPHSSLSCLRTDLERDDGLCVAMDTCSSDSECSAVFGACGTSVVRALYPAASSLKLDSLYCMAVGCMAKGTACPAGEQCIQRVLGPAAQAPDLCLPNCDPDGRCPPNHSCLKRLSPAYPDICAPGTLGRPCETDMDCLIGQCTDVGFGYKLCSRECRSDDDCIPFDQGDTYFFCAEGRCISPESLLWPDCRTDADCGDPGLVCARPSSEQELGGCRMPCAEDGTCLRRAGIVHGCQVWDDRDICQPGLVGRYPCRADADCSPGLQCLDHGGGELYCSIACSADADCRANRQTATGYCAESEVCRPRAVPGSSCQRDEGCQSNRCDTGKCTDLEF